eukprot:CAMPEP_0184674378 /NCGR_PEP_ID=MMETSP0308-20130426/87203_1 /TAXON_ID=38269 /ORGANISM="Gloeochaete witrockiana, Strain SAG 46.84" /LENGTH=264 /DNA_ID=CAMNT_0027121971 /DNA_START=1622 /DNA_END=2416 /DNA_ORIENTATION=+
MATATDGTDDRENDDLSLNIFEEPLDYFKPKEEATYTTFTRKNPRNGPANLALKLPPKHSLWAHMIWNAAIVMSTYLEALPIKGKCVLELGAGAAVPSMICAFNAASKVVIADYPDPPILDAIRHNCEENLPPPVLERVNVQGYIWGYDPKQLLAQIPDPLGFDIIILSDLIFNHSQHAQLIRTCKQCVKPNDGKVLVSFSHHRPDKSAMDLHFFTLAEEAGFKVTKFFEVRMKPMFENDVGPAEVRAVVHMYSMQRLEPKTDS